MKSFSTIRTLIRVPSPLSNWNTRRSANTCNAATSAELMNCHSKGQSLLAP
uniref:Uncharacterized protein n=1 Tax=uncultured marine virus TaxID=186617 RepID=A0A0F7L2R7_9VIRU|nr:hypothetical protein [uncultured marine virus]